MRGKALKEIHVILTETLACLRPGRAKELSAPLYNQSNKQNRVRRKHTNVRKETFRNNKTAPIVRRTERIYRV